ncbi:unnamed protein product [Pedinophyceae sp. YPF-701]|nr:unnamed protein product [Pedinophyceae sp. YPF-701]
MSPASGTARGNSSTAIPLSALRVGDMRNGIVKVSAPPYTVMFSDLELIRDVYEEMSGCAHARGTADITPAAFKRYMQRDSVAGGMLERKESSDSGTPTPRFAASKQRKQRVAEVVAQLDKTLYAKLDREGQAHVTLEDLLAVWYPNLPATDLGMLALKVMPETPALPIDRPLAAKLVASHGNHLKDLGATNPDTVPSAVMMSRLKRDLETRLQRAFFTWAISLLQLQPHEPLYASQVDTALKKAIRLWCDGKAPDEKLLLAGAEDNNFSDFSHKVDPVAMLAQYSQRRDKIISRKF